MSTYHRDGDLISRRSSKTTEAHDFDTASDVGRQPNVMGGTSFILPDDVKLEYEMLVGEVANRHFVRMDLCGQAFVMTNANAFRVFWSILVVLLLVYTGTVFLYRLCFIEFKIPEDPNSKDKDRELSPGWKVLDKITTAVFWIDLAVNFFFTYEDESGHEVKSLRHIVRHYLATHFVVDLIACLPEESVTWALDKSANATQGAKTFRLQRITRLARLMRLARLAKFAQIAKHMKGPVLSWFQRQRGFYLINLTCGLMWIVHVLACGWYLCAALHEDNLDHTWVFRRFVDINETGHKTPLVACSSFDQWMQAMYFTLTVFTTVGFGDMAALTNGEIGYVCLMMLVGAVVHSIIISSVISVVTSSDMVNDFITKNTKLVEAFGSHAEVEEVSVNDMKSWVTFSAKFWMSHQYNKQEMKELIVGKMMPSHLLATLPKALFHGNFVKNAFFHGYQHVEYPPRLPLLLALSIQKADFLQGEYVYSTDEYAFNVCLVLGGLFSYVNKNIVIEHAWLESGRGTGVTLTGIARDRGSGHRSGVEKVAREKDESELYRILPKASYFGDYEVFFNTTRVTSARCESETGILLLLHKTDLKDIMAEFPFFATRWRSAAFRREQARKRLSDKQRLSHRHVGDVRGLACCCIQEWWRKLQSGGGRSELAYRVGGAMKILLRKSRAATIEGPITLVSLHHNQEEMRKDIRQLSESVDSIKSLLTRLVGEKSGSSDEEVPGVFRLHSECSNSPNLNL